MKGRWLFTSEYVCMGHPDKMADQISDAVLDEIVRQDPYGRVACEVLVKTGLVLLAGEITTTAQVNFVDIVRQTIKEIGYDDPRKGFDYKSVGVLTHIERQSPDIASLVNEDEAKKKALGAGDQGIVYGYACRETPDYMPLAIELARKLAWELARARIEKKLTYLRPDGKTQVTIEYEDAEPVAIDTVVVSAQHDEDVPLEKLRQDIIENIIKPTLPAKLITRKPKFFVNQVGKFVVGGPQADCGMTGRKVVIDTYGGMCRHGGGCFSGKDPTKVDRSGSYAARHCAKNIVAAGLADRCEVQLSYVIGVPEPIAISIDTFGSEKIPVSAILEIVKKVFDFSVAGMIEYYKLRRPIYKQTARYGHFGISNPDYTWENLEKVEEVKKYA